MGKFLSILIVGSALIAGVALYYLQVYHFYEEVRPTGEDDVQLTSLVSGEAEPILYSAFEGIDAITGRIIRDVLQQLRQSGTTIFFSSHILEIVERLCSRVAVIASGQVVAQGSIAELREQAQSADDSSLAGLFLRAVGAEDEAGRPSWLQS